MEHPELHQGSAPPPVPLPTGPSSTLSCSVRLATLSTALALATASPRSWSCCVSLLRTRSGAEGIVPCLGRAVAQTLPQRSPGFHVPSCLALSSDLTASQFLELKTSYQLCFSPNPAHCSKPRVSVLTGHTCPLQCPVGEALFTSLCHPDTPESQSYLLPRPTAMFAVEI